MAGSAYKISVVGLAERIIPGSFRNRELIEHKDIPITFAISYETEPNSSSVRISC